MCSVSYFLTDKYVRFLWVPLMVYVSTFLSIDMTISLPFGFELGNLIPDNTSMGWWQLDCRWSHNLASRCRTKLSSSCCIFPWRVAAISDDLWPTSISWSSPKQYRIIFTLNGWINLVDCPLFLQRRRLLWLSVCILAYQVPSKKGSALKGKKMLTLFSV